MTNEEKDRLIAYLVDAGRSTPKETWRPSSWSGARSMSRWSRARSTTRPFSRPPGYGSGASTAATKPVVPDDCRQARPDDDSLDHPIIRVRSTECPTCRRRWAATALGR